MRVGSERERERERERESATHLRSVLGRSGIIHARDLDVHARTQGNAACAHAPVSDQSRFKQDPELGTKSHPPPCRGPPPPSPTQHPPAFSGLKSAGKGQQMPPVRPKTAFKVPGMCHKMHRPSFKVLQKSKKGPQKKEAALVAQWSRRSQRLRWSACTHPAILSSFRCKISQKKCQKAPLCALKKAFEVAFPLLLFLSFFAHELEGAVEAGGVARSEKLLRVSGGGVGRPLEVGGEAARGGGDGASATAAGGLRGGGAVRRVDT